VRNIFTKRRQPRHTGSVSFMFREDGRVPPDPEGIDQDDLELYLIDHGLEEMGESTGEKGEPQLVVRCAFADFGSCRRRSRTAGSRRSRPSTSTSATRPTELPEEQAKEVLELIDKLEQDEDVQKVPFHTRARGCLS
jgi:transcriptional/translational regulatory protein YebC/TACO1